LSVGLRKTRSSDEEISNKKTRGRPETRKIPRIDTTPEELARAIFRNVDRDLQASRKIRFKKRRFS